MSFIQNLFTSRDNNANSATYVGQSGRMWYDPVTNTLRVSDGNTAGGFPVAYATNPNANFEDISANSITANYGTLYIIGDTHISGSANIVGNISPGSNTKIGGVKAGPGANIANDGTLTINTAGLSFSFGDFTANTNILTLVNVDENMILATQGNAEIQLVGNIGFYKTDGATPSGQFFKANKDGQIFIYVPTTDSTFGAVEIIGSTTGCVIAPGLSGAMLHVTGQIDSQNRIYFDGNGDYVAVNGRSWKGNILTGIQAIQAGNDVMRLNATAATTSGIGNVAFAQIRFTAIENQTPTTQGSNINFWTTAAGANANSRVEVANISVANGVEATKFTTAGTVSATGNITGGNLIAISSVIGANVSATGNVVAGNVTTVGNVSGNYFVGNGAALTGLNAFGNAYANGVAVLATTGSSSLTFTPGNNITIVGNNGLKSITIGMADNPTMPGNISVTGNIIGGNASVTGNIVTGNVSTTGNVTAGYVIGNGYPLTSINGSNVVGAVGSATTAITVTGNAQANITSVGTLTSLTVTGNTTSGNLLTAGIVSSTGNAIHGNISTAGLLKVTGNTQLGGNANVSITGGTNKYALITDGNGNLSWANVAGIAGAPSAQIVSTFAPTLAASGGGTFTYTAQSGYYVKSGQSVSVYFTIIISSASGTSGTISINNLPFASLNSGTASAGGGALDDYSFASLPTHVTGIVPSNSSQFDFYWHDRAGSVNSINLMTAAELGTSATLIGRITYIAAS